MSRVTVMSDKTDIDALREKLRKHRLDRAWSYERLSDEIERVTSIRLSPPTLSRFLDGSVETLPQHVHQIHRYFEGVQAA